MTYDLSLGVIVIIIISSSSSTTCGCSARDTRLAILMRRLSLSVSAAEQIYNSPDTHYVVFSLLFCLCLSASSLSHSFPVCLSVCITMQRRRNRRSNGGARPRNAETAGAKVYLKKPLQ